MDLENYAQYRETKVHEQPGFSYNTYLCTIPDDFEKVSLHWHDQFELIYIKKGTGLISVDLTSYEAGAGTIAVVLPGQLHAIGQAGDSRMEYENIIFSLSMLESQEADWCRQAFFEPLKAGRLRFPVILKPGTSLHERASACIDAADAACEKKKTGYPLAVKGEVLVFFSVLYEYRVSDDAVSDTCDSDRIKRILSWVRGHYGEKLSVTEAAAAAGYSASYFMRFFKENTGQTFCEYLIDYRLAAAARLLHETDETIAAVAMECGFENISYFCRSFKKKYGMTPRGMRKPACESRR